MFSFTCDSGSGKAKLSSSTGAIGFLTSASTVLAPFLGSALGGGAFLAPFAFAYSSKSFLRILSRFSYKIVSSWSVNFSLLACFY